MLIKTLRLTNFRNHHDFSVVFDKQILFLIGKNTSGKTNILEALNILTFGKSKKSESESDFICKGEDHASISAQIENRDKFSLQVIYAINAATNRVARRYLKNNLSHAQSDFAGHFLSVSFFPEELRMVSEGPSLRRNFLNQCLTQTDTKYRKSLQIYERAVRSRNAILEKIKNGVGRRQELEYWNKIAIENGQYLTKKREEFVNFVGARSPRPMGGSPRVEAGETPPLHVKIIYDCSEISPARLSQYADAEIASTSTLVGPHRDDLIFMDNARNLKTFGSRGEQRLLILLLKLKELEYIEAETHEKPVLLLDDIFSELDFTNRHFVLNLINGRQTVITTADEKEIEGLGLEKIQKVYL
jgi:DNA replication and repair protein RecF